MQLLDFPTDILLYVLGYLRLDDAFLLLSTCTRIRKLSDNRSLWIQLLRQTESDGSQPLACPLQTDLSQLSLSDLQKIARHTVRLEKNWSSENPRIIGEVTAVQCEEINGPFSILVVIPGTSILVLHHGETLFCYDGEMKTTWPWWSIGKVQGHAQFSEHGKHFIAVVCEKGDIHFLHVFRADYGLGVPNMLHSVYGFAFPFPILVRTAFMQGAMVGIIYSHRLSIIAGFYLSVFDMCTNMVITIPLPDSLRRTTHQYCSASVQGNYVYIAFPLLHASTCRLYACDISAPWDDNNMEGRLNHLSPVTFEHFNTLPDALANDRYPVICQILHTVDLVVLQAAANDITGITHVLFHPDIFPSSRSSDTVRLDIPCQVRETNPNVFSTHSGNYVLICTSTAMQDESLDGAEPELHILRFVKDPPESIQVRQLPIPLFIQSELEADRIHSMALDDHLGVLYLTSDRGCIFAVPFA